MDMKSIWGDYPEIRFCKVLAKTKRPFEKDWTNKLYSLEEIEPHIKSGGNYGVIAQGTLIIVDSDEPEVYEKVNQHLPETLTVKTANGHHSYFFCPELEKKITLIDKDKKHFGEVQAGGGSQCIGPGSTHPSGTKYEVVPQKDPKAPLPKIATISLLQLHSAIETFSKPLQLIKEVSIKEANNYEFEQGVDADQILIRDVWEPTGEVKETPTGDLIGTHPVHGSTGGQNFAINEGKNTWHCYRCDSGGSALYGIAVKEGIIQCDEAQPGALRGDDAKKCIDIARENGWGLTEETFEFTHTPQMQMDATVQAPLLKKVPKAEQIQELLARQYTDFRDLAQDDSFFVKGFISPKTLTMLYSPPGQFKSFISLYLAMCIANGREWLDLETEKNAVLYLDGENNDQILKTRLQQLHKGHNFESEDFPLWIIKHGTMMDGKKQIHLPWINGLRKIIREKKIKILFIDTLHRYCSYDENSSDDINKLYQEVFKRLIEEFGLSIVFLHHATKTGGYRGTSDFLGMVDTSYVVSRPAVKGNATSAFTLKNEKNRSGEQDLITGNIDFTDPTDDELGEITITRTHIKSTTDADKDQNVVDEKENILDIFEPHKFLRLAEIEEALIAIGLGVSKRSIQRRLKELVSDGKIVYNKKERSYQIFQYGQQNI